MFVPRLTVVAAVLLALSGASCRTALDGENGSADASTDDAATCVLLDGACTSGCSCRPVYGILVDYERRCASSEIILACRTRADATHCIDSPAFDCYQRSGADGGIEVFITPYMYNDWDDARFTRCSSELSAKSMLLINTACPPP